MKKQLIRLTESDIHSIIKESVHSILKEYDYEDGHPYGWPDDYLDDELDDVYVDEHEISKLEDYASGIIDVANMLDCNVEELKKAKKLIDNFVYKHKNMFKK